MLVFVNRCMVKNLWYINTRDYYLAIKKKDILPFATAWMDLESMMLSEINQSARQVLYDSTHMWNLMNKIN